MEHQTGLLWRAVRTSTAIPVGFAPIKFDDHLHVDGAIMNNFPVDLMYEAVEGGQVFGVMVSPVGEVEEKIDDLQDNVSGWKLLINRFNPFAVKLYIPSLPNIFFRSLLVNGKHHFWAVQHMTDLLIKIDQSHYGFLELDKYKELIALGYDTALEKIIQWKADRAPKRSA